MSPVVSVCPVHGPFESRGFMIRDSESITLSGSSERCPQCGRQSAVMEGVFDFDAEGIAKVISAPEWSVNALRAVQGELKSAAKALDSRAYTDDRAYALLEKKLDRLRDEFRAQGELSVGHFEELSAAIKGLTKKLSRHRLSAVLIGVAFALGAVADAVAVGELVGDVTSWVVEQINEGQNEAS